MITQLIKAGANVNIKNYPAKTPLDGETQLDGETPLDFFRSLTQYNDSKIIEIIQLFINANVDIDPLNRFLTKLKTARASNVEIKTTTPEPEDSPIAFISNQINKLLTDKQMDILK